MSMGKLVVATNGASFEQLINDGENGFLCDRDNAEAFFEAIIKALELSMERKIEMSTQAKKTVERLSPESIYDKYLEYYQNVIRNW